MASLAELPYLRDPADVAADALLAALRVCDDETCEHAYRVTELALELTEVVAPELAGEPALRHGYLLHDIGKIAVPASILLKAGPLSETERRIMRSHATLGGRILDELPLFSSLVRDVVACHHEHWDGRGYPLGLQRHQIPLGSRIFAVADAFDAMTHDRPYRAALSRDEALGEIDRCAGAQFDPGVVVAFLTRVAPRENESSDSLRIGALPPRLLSSLRPSPTPQRRGSR